MLSCFISINSYFDQWHVRKQGLKTTHSTIVEQNNCRTSHLLRFKRRAATQALLWPLADPLEGRHFFVNGQNSTWLVTLPPTCWTLTQRFFFMANCKASFKTSMPMPAPFFRMNESYLMASLTVRRLTKDASITSFQLNIWPNKLGSLV